MRINNFSSGWQLKSEVLERNKEALEKQLNKDVSSYKKNCVHYHLKGIKEAIERHNKLKDPSVL